MQYNDLNSTVYEGWTNVRIAIENGVHFSFKQTKSLLVVENDLPKKEDNPIVHIRPHSQKRAYRFANGEEIGNIQRDANELPDGQWMTTQSFWINNDYILDQLNRNF
jgi:hypothetical protein